MSRAGSTARRTGRVTPRRTPPAPGPRQATGPASVSRPDDPSGLAGLEDRTLVLLPATPFAETLIRRVHPLTHRVRGPFWCLHVTKPGAVRDENDELALSSACMLARSLGGEVIEVEGDSVEEAALRIAREKRATQIIVGIPRRQKPWPFRGAALADRLARAYGEAYVLMIAEPLGD